MEDASVRPLLVDDADDDASARVDDDVSLAVLAVLDEYVESLGKGELTT